MNFLRTIKQNAKILIYFSFVCLLFFIVNSTVYGATVLTKPTNNLGLVGYWTFDGKDMISNVRDASGNGNNGNISGQTSTTTVPGVIGQALEFDGNNDSVNAGSATSLDDIQNQGGGGMTVSFWIKPDSNSTKTIISKGPNQNNAGFWTISKTSNTNPARLTFSKEGSTDSSKSYNSLLVTGTWQHITLVWDGTMTFTTGVTLYKNGVLVANAGGTDGTTAGTDAAQSICIGNISLLATNSCTTTGGFDGALDDVRIYNRMLSSSEVVALYNFGKTELSQAKAPGTTSNGLLSWWTLDAGNTNWRANTITDASGHGCNANIFNMSTSTAPVSGKIGQAFLFDGVNDYLIASGCSSLIPNNEYTQSFWMKMNRAPASHSYKMVGGSYYRQALMYSGAAPHKAICTNDGGAFDGASSLSDVDDGNWHHIVCTSTSGVVSVYVDGAYEASANSTLSVNNSSAFQVGVDGDGTSLFFPGSIDDVRNYDHVLSASEIRQLYNFGGSKINQSTNTGRGTLNQGLVALWSFDGKDISGSTIYDRVNGNNGTMVNSFKTMIGKIGQAVNFDSAHTYMTVPANSTINSLFSTGGSISFWIKPNSGGQANAGYWVSKYGGGGGYTLFANSGGDDTSIDPGFEFNIEWSGGTAKWRTGTANISYKNWHHIVFTYDGSSTANNPILYVDGSVVSLSRVVAPVGTIVSDTGGMENGGNSAESRVSNGPMDDLRLYKKILTPSEVKQLYNMGR